jgi:hypothetical protein
MKVPIACTLNVDEAVDRVEDWRSALRSAVSEVRRPDPGRAEFQLTGDPGQIAALMELARQEKACCGFFRFAFEVESDGVVLVASVPPEAVEVLDGFAGLASTG